ncbi:bis(5'-adenosyl)-triphosphatase enpp4-like [Hydractinia symbiolongicarpus]|uniref:bis(5'-adenosyl)-triphosphatase enpp4-like n=1 Tax=Hydractinia symbiolongicarpus TaxID=13093 RepID=UPI00254DB004|nr:bis(5'-adenosyl)-triphosphatase enpp4-like [Hydractinia symbiolongicarpus]
MIQRILLLALLLHVRAIYGVSKKSRVFLLSLDGFIADFYKHSQNMPNLERLARQGVRATRLIPSFPPDTFPSMTSLITGLYTESHGIIANKFYHVQYDEKFSYVDDPASWERNGKFYTQEPVWLTNQKQGGSSAVYYWPGYCAYSEKPTYLNHPISARSSLEKGRRSIDEINMLLDNDPDLNLVALWVDSPDWAGHRYGRHSKEYAKELERVDKEIIGYLMDKLKDKPDINLILVSDHGIIDGNGNSTKTKARFLEDYLRKDSYKLIFGGPSCALWPANGAKTEELLQRLMVLNHTGHYRVYRKQDIPEYLHYKHNKNTAPILVLSEAGWLLKEKRKPGRWYGGSHGYDVSYEGMGTLFAAHGPAFKHGLLLDAFESVNVVPLVAHLLGIKARPNNGTLKPFQEALSNDFSVQAASILSAISVTHPCGTEKIYGAIRFYQKSANEVGVHVKLITGKIFTRYRVEIHESGDVHTMGCFGSRSTLSTLSFLDVTTSERVPYVTTDRQGRVNKMTFLTGHSLSYGKNSIIGRSVVIQSNTRIPTEEGMISCGEIARV